MFKDFQDKYGCIFVHVPKNAGTSIERSVFETNKWLIGHKKAITYLRNNKDKFYEYFSFGFVRNPYDRVCSAYHYLKNGGAGGNDLEWSKIHLSKYKSFKEFILDLKNEDIKEEILKYYHFMPQYEFLCNEWDEIIVNFIGYYENLEADFEKICNILNITRTIPWANKSKHDDFRTYYDKQCYEIVKDVYLKDFLIFDYDLCPKNNFTLNKNYLLTKLNNKNKNISKLMLEHYYKNKNLKQIKHNISELQNKLNENTKLLNEQKAKTNEIQTKLNEKLKQKDINLEQSKNKLNELQNKLNESTKQSQSTIKSLENQLNEKTKQTNEIQTKLNENTKLLNEQKAKTNEIQSTLNERLKNKKQKINELSKSLAVAKLKNHLAYKLGKSTSKAFFLFTPFVVFIVWLNHAFYKQKIQGDYSKALWVKNTYEYKLGELIINSFKKWYKLQFLALPFLAYKLKKSFKQD